MAVSAVALPVVKTAAVADVAVTQAEAKALLASKPVTVPATKVAAGVALPVAKAAAVPAAKTTLAVGVPVAKASAVPAAKATLATAEVAAAPAAKAAEVAAVPAAKAAFYTACASGFVGLGVAAVCLARTELVQGLVWNGCTHLLCGAGEQPCERMAEFIRAQLRAMDMTTSKSNRRRNHELVEQELQSAIARCDKDEDGVLSKEEAALFWSEYFHATHALLPEVVEFLRERRREQVRNDTALAELPAEMRDKLEAGLVQKFDDELAENGGLEALMAQADANAQDTELCEGLVEVLDQDESGTLDFMELQTALLGSGDDGQPGEGQRRLASHLLKEGKAIAISLLGRYSVPEETRPDSRRASQDPQLG